MSRMDRIFAGMRERAMLQPLTRANTFVFPEAQLPGGIAIGLSLNK